jgi:hypothetical protein
MYIQLRPAVWIGTSLALLALDCNESPAQPSLPGPDAQACKLLPTAQIEAALGATVTRQAGTDSPKMNSCTVTAGESASARIEIHEPGQVGLPADVTSGLAAAKATIGEAMGDAGRCTRADGDREESARGRGHQRALTIYDGERY